MNEQSTWHWDRRDICCLLLITTIGGIFRLWSVTSPGGFILDEFYAADACLYVGGSPSVCHTDHELTSVHPPLGKWLIGTGILLVGFGPAGWRIASVAAGTLTICALYFMARKLFNSTLGAAIASGLLAFDFLHFVFSRTAMLDIFVTFFIVIAFMFAVLDRARLFAPQSEIRRPAYDLRWRILAGTVAGAACACKWSGLPALASLLLLTGSWEWKKALTIRGQRPIETIRRITPSLFLCFVLIPASVYMLSYTGRLGGTIFAWPWAENSWLRALVERQIMMLGFHTDLSGSHPYTSPAWSWLLLKRPVLMYFKESGQGAYREILGFGSPLVWWASIAALLWATFSQIKDRRFDTPVGVILIGFIACYGPWLLIGQSRQQVFLYYLLPAVPFMCLALAAVAVKLANSSVGSLATGVFAAGSIGLFGYYYPLLVARPLPYSSWEARMLFRNCDGSVTLVGGAQSRSAFYGHDVDQIHQRSQEHTLRPQTTLGAPPQGWCWP